METVTVTVIVLIVILFVLAISFMSCWFKRVSYLKTFYVLDEESFNKSNISKFKKQFQSGHIKSNSQQQLNKVENSSDKLNESMDGLNTFDHAVLEIIVPNNKVEDDRISHLSVDSKESFYSTHNNRRFSTYSTNTHYFDVSE